MRFQTFFLAMAVLVVALAFDTSGNAGDTPVAEPVAKSPIITRIRERSVSVSPGKVERSVNVCGPNGCRIVNRSSVVESAPVEGRVRSRSGLLSRVFGRRSRSVSVSRSYGCSK